jgi:hypothetical protein
LGCLTRHTQTASTRATGKTENAGQAQRIRTAKTVAA